MRGLSVGTKIFISLLFSVNIFLADDLKGILIASILFAAAIPFFGKKIDWRMIVKLSRGFIYIFAFTFTAHYFIQKNNTEESLFYTFRIVALILGNAIAAASITVDEFIRILDHAVKRLPISRELASKSVMIFRLTLNFVPILKEEGIRIYKSQKARGTDFGSANLITKANSYLSLMIPILVATIKKADDVTMAMKARRFTGYMEQQYDQLLPGKGLIDLFMIIAGLTITAANLFHFKLY